MKKYSKILKKFHKILKLVTSSTDFKLTNFELTGGGSFCLEISTKLLDLKIIKENLLKLFEPICFKLECQHFKLCYQTPEDIGIERTTSFVIFFTV